MIRRKLLKDFIVKEWIFIAAITLLLILTFLFPNYLDSYLTFIHWKTIFSLAGLLIIITAINLSGYFSFLVRRILKTVSNERNLAIVLITFSFFLSAILTNDISLFIIVPLTLSLQRVIHNDISKFVIFEAISVNAGSSFMPIGNPQNIFLWHQWKIGFFSFILKMFPLALLMYFLLLSFIVIFIPRNTIRVIDINIDKVQQNKTLLFFSLLMFLIFIFSLDRNFLFYFIATMFFIYLIFFPYVIKKVDWILLLLIAVFFIEFTIPTQLDVIKRLILSLNLHSTKQWYIFSALSSQVISNVPASIFVSRFSCDWLGITYGVNVGGNGLVIGSLANIIALRMTKDKKIWFSFHKYSIPFFIISLLIGFLLL